MLTPPGWLQNAGNTHTAAQLRQYLTGLLSGAALTTPDMRARGGVSNHHGGKFAVSQTASPSMAVLVKSGIAVIPNSQSTAGGTYFVTNDADVTLAVAASHATLGRKDLVVINVRDTAYSGGSNDVQLQVVTGTPAASPVNPAMPNNALLLAVINVVAASTTVVNANIDEERSFFAANGGVVPIVSQFGYLPAVGEFPDGTLFWDIANEQLLIQRDSAWPQIWPVARPATSRTILATSGTTSSTSYTEVLTGITPAVIGGSITVPESGEFLILWAARMANGAGTQAMVSFRMGTGSTVDGGTPQLAADDDRAIEFNGGNAQRASCHYLVKGRTPGEVLNVCLYFKVSSGTGTFLDFDCTLIPV